MKAAEIIISEESAAQLLAMLKEEAGHACQKIFRRIAIVDKLLKNDEWLMVAFRGDVAEAIDVLHKDHFGDTHHLSLLLDVYRTFPEQDDWEKHRWNLNRIIAEYEISKAKQKEPSRSVRRATIKELEEVQLERDEAKRQLNLAQKENETLQRLSPPPAPLVVENPPDRIVVERTKKDDGEVARVRPPHDYLRDVAQRCVNMILCTQSPKDAAALLVEELKAKSLV